MSDLTGLGRATVEQMVRKAEGELANRPSGEFAAVGAADREWVEGVLTRAYVGLAADPARQVMSESLIGAEAVARLADKAMTDDDRRNVDAASDDIRAYLTALSESIAYLISGWYVMNEASSRAAASQAAGETLRTVRTIADLVSELKAHLDSSIGQALTRLERSTLEDLPPGPAPERIVFELDFNFVPLATDPEFTEVVEAGVVAVIKGRPVHVEVVIPTLDGDPMGFGDPVIVAQLERSRQRRAQRLRLGLVAFFSSQVEAAWGIYLQGVRDRVTVVRAILAGQEAAAAKLDVWRTTPPVPFASAPIWLTADEVDAVVESVGLGHWDDLRFGPGWRAADELPRSVIIEKVMPSILAELVRQDVTSEEGWDADVLSLPSWHIGQG